LDWLVLTIQIHTTAMVGAAGAAGAADAAAAVELQATHRRHRWRTGSRRSYRIHSGGSGGELETLRSGAGGGPAPADLEGARSLSHGPAAERPVLGLGEPESTHRWTGTTCRAAPLACTDWSEERDVGRSRLDRVEGGGDNGKPRRAGRHPRIAVTGVLISAVGALVITPRGRVHALLYKG
jgi:hypothetical protein